MLSTVSSALSSRKPKSIIDTLVDSFVYVLIKKDLPLNKDLLLLDALNKDLPLLVARVVLNDKEKCLVKFTTTIDESELTTTTDDSVVKLNYNDKDLVPLDIIGLIKLINENKPTHNIKARLFFNHITLVRLIQTFRIQRYGTEMCMHWFGPIAIGQRYDKMEQRKTELAVGKLVYVSLDFKEYRGKIGEMLAIITNIFQTSSSPYRYSSVEVITTTKGFPAEAYINNFYEVTVTDYVKHYFGLSENIFRVPIGAIKIIPDNYADLENTKYPEYYGSVTNYIKSFLPYEYEESLEQIGGPPQVRGPTGWGGSNRNPKQLLHSKKSNNSLRRKKSIKFKNSRKPRKYKKTKKNKKNKRRH